MTPTTIHMLVDIAAVAVCALLLVAARAARAEARERDAARAAAERAYLTALHRWPDSPAPTVTGRATVPDAAPVLRCEVDDLCDRGAVIARTADRVGAIAAVIWRRTPAWMVMPVAVGLVVVDDARDRWHTWLWPTGEWAPGELAAIAAVDDAPGRHHRDGVADEHTQAERHHQPLAVTAAPGPGTPEWPTASYDRGLIGAGAR